METLANREVFVSIWEHKNGIDIALFETEKKAYENLATIIYTERFHEDEMLCSREHFNKCCELYRAEKYADVVKLWNECSPDTIRIESKKIH